MFKTPSQKEIQDFRRLLLIAGTVYLIWWFAVEMLLPGSFNPAGSRLLVVLGFFITLALSFRNAFVLRHLESLLIGCLWLLTAHYFYLFLNNGNDLNWMVGSFITVMAITFCFFSLKALLAYTAFVLFCAVVLVLLIPELQRSVFLPGLITILLQANLGWRTRLNLIKDIHHTNERFKLLFDSAFEGILVHEKGIIVNANEALCKMIGRPREELLGSHVTEQVHPEELELLKQKMQQAEVLPFETRMRKKDGTVLNVEVRAKNIFYENTTARLVTILNVADRQKALEEHIHSLTLAENVRVRDEFITIASHELKTPLTALKLQTLMIERDVKKQSTGTYTPAFLNNLLQMFSTQVDQLTEIVDTLLDVSKISAGRLELELQNMDLADLLGETISSLHIQGRVIVHAPRHLPVDADKARIKQVLENLLNNAVKFGEGKPVTAKLETQEKFAVLSIEDRGAGIAAEDLERIFERFERAIPAKNISGFGLGLYVTREIVRAHGGLITADSKPGAGTTFTVRLPLIRTKSQ